jgi:hypothetical protein
MGNDDDQTAAESFDLDLKAEDSRLREALGKPTVINLPDGDVIHVANIGEWSGAAMKAAANADWNAWAAAVIDDEEELEAFQEADLVNYQLEAVFEACSRTGGVGGKSKRSGNSSRATRKR